MNAYLVEITETRTIFAEVAAQDEQQVIVRAGRGEGKITEPYPPELVAVKVVFVQEVS